jgi:cell division protein FtsB
MRTARRRSIDWERLGGRWALLVLYIAPLQNYLRQRGESDAKRSELRALQAENARLKTRAKALTRDSVIELEARRLGMVRADERSFVVK